MLFISITGPSGSGKDTASEYLGQQLGLKHISGGDMLRIMLTKLELEPTKKAVSGLGLFLRAHYKQDILLQRIIAEAKSQGGAVHSGSRAPVTIQAIKDIGGHVVYIDAPESLRYERMHQRGREGDGLTDEELGRLDKTTHESRAVIGEDLTTVKKMADVVISNNTSKEELYRALDKFIRTVR